jgi:hypothetical protein
MGDRPIQLRQILEAAAAFFAAGQIVITAIGADHGGVQESEHMASIPRSQMGNDLAR